ncbi:MAG TPA: cbb3-type cytochrome c oxidase subunit I [Gemmatimonadaceae bacterium]|nr:cbb3-type cytochrome c oxidase subunit I [Gemmatimonadaceae bacterium]
MSMRFFMLMMVLFLLQVGFGLLIAAQRVDPTLLAGTLNFNVARSEHLNLGIFWILCGFIGAILFVGPLLAKRELAAPWLVKFLFYALIAIVLWNVFTLGLAQRGIAGWWEGQPWLQEGLEYLDAGRVADVLILVGFSVLAYIVLRTFPKIRDWNEIHWGLGIGVTALAAMWVFGMFFVGRIDLQEYFRWFVVHYWVEGVWEVIHISLIGALIVYMFGASIRSVGYAVFWGVVLVWLSGLIGNAHHYFWVGTPEFWQFWGSLFSALEPVPLVFCFWHIYLDAHHENKPLVNLPSFYVILGSVVLEQVGAGILGFTMTFALTNVWSHGTWITPSHAHLALFGTFGMLGIGAAYFAIPALRGARDFDQRLGKLAFWLVFTGMLGMTFAFALGGTVQIFFYRVLGLDWFGGDIYPAMTLYRILVPVFGLIFTVGAGLVAFDLFTLGARRRIAGDVAHEHHHVHHDHVHHAPTPVHAPATGWARPLTGFEAGIWLLGMWIFGTIITLGLLSFNLNMVRMGDPHLPYVMAGVGYPGLLLVTLLFVSRFLTSLEARGPAPAELFREPPGVAAPSYVPGAETATTAGR